MWYVEFEFEFLYMYACMHPWNGWMDGWMGGWSNGWVGGCLVMCVIGWMVEWMSEWVFSWMDGWMGWIDGWRDWRQPQIDSWVTLCSQWVILLIHVICFLYFYPSLATLSIFLCLLVSASCLPEKEESSHILINAWIIPYLY